MKNIAWAIIFLVAWTTAILALEITSLVKSNNTVTITWDEKTDLYKVYEAASPTGTFMSAAVALHTNCTSLVSTNSNRFYLVKKEVLPIPLP
jgi:hypothetical protein